MNKKAFTLIELIAVIVILAIIMLIAVPKILDVIETSKKDTLVSGTKIIANAIQADSISTGKKYYKLDSDGKLYRCTDEMATNCTEQVKYSGKLIPLSGDSVIFVKNDGSVELQSGATICDKSKKYCISASNGDISLQSINKELIVQSSEIVTTTTSSSTTTSEERTIIKSGDITGFGPVNSVTYVFYSDRTLEINGTGEGQMRDFGFNNTGYPNSLVMQLNCEFFIPELEENLVEGKTIYDFPEEEFSMLKALNTALSLYTVDDIAEYIYANSEEGEYQNLEEAKTVILSTVNGLFGENGEYIYNHFTSQNHYFNSVKINEGVLNTGFGAFIGSLNNISIADTVTEIEAGSFMGFSNYLSLDLGEGVQAIGFAAFMMNRGLHFVTIPASVTYIEENAFFQTGLTSIMIEGNPKRFNNHWTAIGFPPELMPN